MRSINSLKNILTSVGGQTLTIVLQFLSRTIFIYTLGIEYLGISSLFTNILQVLNITELGIGSAIVFSLFKPLAENDAYQISAIMNFLKKVYYLVGLLIGAIGIILIPFLPFIITDTTVVDEINLIFILFLFQSVSTYFFKAYKVSIIKADQKGYVYNIIKHSINTVTVIAQIVILLIFKSFILYLILGIVSNIIVNLLVSKKVDKLYPFLRENKGIVLDSVQKKEIYKNIFGISMYKINSTIVRSTDSIVISSFISTIAVGMYSNYYLIVSSLITLTKLVFSSFTASIGNLFVTEDNERNNFIFRCISFFSFWLYGFFAISLWILINHFIVVWIGPDFLFPEYIVAIIVLDFLMDGYQQVVISYKDACGLFWHGRYRPVATAILNIIISVSLAPKIGIPGVLLGTIISRLLTTWWFEPYMVHKYAFRKSSLDYFVRYFKFFLLVVVTGIITHIIVSPFSMKSLSGLFIKALIVTMVPNSIFYVLFRNTPEIKYIINTIKKIIKRKKHVKS